MNTVGAINEHLLDVGPRMRVQDRTEVFAVIPHLTLDDWMGWISSMPGLIVAATYRQRRVAVMGAVFLAPHLCTTWMVGTDDLKLPGARINTHRAAIRLHELIDAEGITRCQASPWAGNTEARLWLLSLGYRYEGEHPGMGEGELTDFVTYGRVR